jgi:hypothetical protein
MGGVVFPTWSRCIMDKLSRRNVLHSLGLSASAGFLAGCSSALGASDPQKTADSKQPADAKQPDAAAQSPAAAQIATEWNYVALDPAVVAEDAYRKYAEGGCMFGVFAGVIATIAKIQPEPFGSFPCHMMRYGAGGVSHWGSICGACNGGAALIGLFERDKKRSENLVAELLAWYEKTELPIYHPKTADDATPFVKSVSNSILCHASVSRWCKESGSVIDGPERKERCRRLTADVAAKVVELLNANLKEPCQFAGLNPDVKSCLSCHNDELHDTIGKMRCNACHPQLSSKHPSILPKTLASNEKPQNGDK